MDTPITKYAIEDSFPIVEINRLAIPERNAFKPIYRVSSNPPWLHETSPHGW
ncbi:MAG: hypothetical protein JRJ57_12840 [Deltaproteobacteria bacterium]|nr:hypothetical protein [Deltaproteobacteria bacterium]